MRAGERALRISFWAGAGLSGWVLAGYPLSLLAARARPGPDPPTEAPLPSVSIVIPAYRERTELPAKLRALEGLDYPAGLLEVIVAVDEDEGLARAAAAAKPDATILFESRRQGKGSALNRALEFASGEAVLLTDANNVLEPEALRAAAARLADPAVAGVGGRRDEQDSPYASYECAIRRLESRSGSVAALSGEFVLVRRDLVPPFPEDVVNDDLWLLCELVRAGGRVVYEPRARSRELPLGPSAELERRTRMSAGRVMLLGSVRGLPRSFALRLISHKFARLLLPPSLAATLLSAIALSRNRAYRVVAAGQLAVIAAAAGTVLRGGAAGRAGIPARISRELVLGVWATARGVVRGARGRQSPRWEAVR